MNLWRW